MVKPVHLHGRFLSSKPMNTSRSHQSGPANPSNLRYHNNGSGVHTIPDRGLIKTKPRVMVEKATFIAESYATNLLFCNPKQGFVPFVPKKRETGKPISLFLSAGSTGLEPAASGLTGRRYNQLNYDPDYLAWRQIAVRAGAQHHYRRKREAEVNCRSDAVAGGGGHDFLRKR